jgi:hypothetical protein
MASAKIRLFDDGRFVGTRTPSVIDGLYARNLVTLERNRKGFIVAANCVHVAKLEGSRPISGCSRPPRPQRSRR